MPGMTPKDPTTGSKRNRLVQKVVPFAKPYGIHPRWTHRLRIPGTSIGARYEGGHLTLGRIGNLEVRLARSAREVRKAQALRYRVFYEEMSAVADRRTQHTRRDADAFDPICDHLLVIDHEAPAKKFRSRKNRIVGTYRLLRQDVAERHGGFYTAQEYDIAPMIAAHPGKRFLELGRSCVLKPYRDKRTVELLWHGIWSYVLMHGIDAMFGCASLEGTDPDALALPLSFLHHRAEMTPPEWQVRALPDRYTEMNRMPVEDIHDRTALRALPPLVKGYMRVGCHFGHGAVIDHQFGTTDVLVVLPIEQINPRYVTYYGDTTRYAH